MKNPKISAALATFNEEKNIVDCIESLKTFADEIVVVDGTSSDRTAELAKREEAKVIVTANKSMFHINKNMAFKNCRSEWIFYIDADERVSGELARELKDVIGRNPPENGFWVNRKNWFLGGFLKKGGAYPNPDIRFFKNGKGRLAEKSVHEKLDVDGKVGHLKNDLIHLADPTFERYLIRANRYTDLTADDIKSKDPGREMWPVFFYMILKPTATFLNIYFRHKGYEDGFRGFIWALFSSAHHFYAYVKYWSDKNNT